MSPYVKVTLYSNSVPRPEKPEKSNLNKIKLKRITSKNQLIKAGLTMLLKKVYTLVFIRNDGQILLGLKKRGFGVNKWNGFGGKVEPNESIIDAAARELKEECCVCVKNSDLKNIGHLEFTFEGEPTMMDVRVFSTAIYQGTPTETEEMCPRWFDCKQVPFENMWPDDKIWFPYMLTNKLFYGRFHYQGLDTILNYNIEELISMEEFYVNKK